MTTRTLIIVAALLSGLLAGMSVDRALVQLPAWQHLGAGAWAEFSRNANLGRGLIIYPVEAVAAALFTMAAAIGSHFDHECSRVARVLLDVAAVLLLGSLIVTAISAPMIFSIRDQNDPVLLQRAFDGWWYWNNLRGTCQVLAFVAQLAALDVFLHQRKAPLP